MNLIFQTKRTFDWTSHICTQNFWSVVFFEMYRKIRVFSEMLVFGIRGNLLGLGCLNTILALVFALYGWNTWKFHLNCKLILKNTCF